MSNVSPIGGGPAYPDFGRVEEGEEKLLIEQYGAEAVGLLKQGPLPDSVIESLIARLVKERLITRTEASELSALLAKEWPHLPDPPTEDNVAKWLEKVSTILDRASGCKYSNPDATVAFRKLASQMETLSTLVKSGILTPPKAGIIVALMEISWGIGA